MTIEIASHHWTPEQAWAIHQLLEQLQSELQQHFGKDIAYYERREALLELYIKKIEQMSEEERIIEGLWLESEIPEPF